MKLIILSSVALAVAAMLSSCVLEKRHTSDGVFSADYVSVSYPITNFSELDASGAEYIVFRQAPADSVRIEGASSAVNNVVVDQKGECLSIRMKSEGFKLPSMDGNSPKVTVYLSSESLNKVVLSGANDFSMADSVNVKELAIELSGAGNVDISSLYVQNLFSVGLSGAGDIDIDDATVGSFRVRMSGAGDLDANVKGAATVYVRVSGAGDASLNLVDCGDVECNASGAGDVDLSGNAARLRYDTSGAADVNFNSLSLSGEASKY